LPHASEISIGFDYTYYPSTEPCTCWVYSSDAFRGRVLFKVDQVPQNFVSAKLVLTPKAKVKRHLSRVTLITRMLRTSANTASVPDATMTVSASADQVTAISSVFAALPHSLQNDEVHPFPKSSAGRVKINQQTLGYTIDVTQGVHAWLSENKAMQGYILVGPDEATPEEKDVSFFVRYNVSLHFVVN
jgi:hypothetical protein